MEGLALSHYVFMQPHVKKRLEFLNVDNLTVWEMWMFSLFCCAFALQVREWGFAVIHLVMRP